MADASFAKRSQFSLQKIGRSSSRLALKACFAATSGESDFSIVLIGGYGSQPSRQPPSHDWQGRDGDLPVPAQKA